MHTLKERALHPRRRPLHHELAVLRDVSFTVGHGEFLGVVGRNGSGKSTLLRAIAGIYSIDSGAIYVDGRVSAFIELGVGFNLDLFAPDNIVTNLMLLGCSAGDARARIESVLEFAELAEFVDLKLKNYSSGMLVRLGFSVMCHADAEILLLDEVLAVGDAGFRRKCEEEFDRLRMRGATGVLVTHDLNALRRYCDRALLIEGGRVIVSGDPREVGERYLQMNFSAEARAAAEAMVASAGHAMPEPFESVPEQGMSSGEGGATICEAWFEDSEGRLAPTLQQGARCCFAMRVRFDIAADDPRFAMSIVNDDRLLLLTFSGSAANLWHRRIQAGEELIFRVRFENVLGPGRYRTTAEVILPGDRVLDRREDILVFMVTTTRPTGALVRVRDEVTLEHVPPSGQAISR